MSLSSKENMKLALKAVSDGMSIRQASAKFSVPKSTLHSRLNRGKVNEVKLEKSGKLCDADEQRLVNWLVYCHHLGYFQVNHTRLSIEAENLSKSHGAGHKFNTEWCKYFTKRHVRVKNCLDLYKNRQYFDKQALEIWFRSLESYCKELGMQEALQSPQQLFFCCKLHITDNLKMMLAFSADGLATPPLIINANLKDSKEIVKHFDELQLPRGWVKYNCVEKAYHQDQDNIYNYYLEFVLKSFLMQRGLDKPILLFQRYQNATPKVSTYELCCNFKIFPVNAFPAAFKIGQSLQNDIWAKVKIMEDKHLHTYMELAKSVLLHKLTKPKMFASFRDSGIYPLDSTKVNPDLKLRLQINTMESDTIETDTQGFCEIEYVNTEPMPAEVTAEVPAFKPCITLSMPEFRDIVGVELSDKLEAVATLKGKQSKEFRALLEIFDKFKADLSEGPEVRNEPLLDDADPLSGSNETMVVEPELEWM